ncbi:uncharacterized protein BP01DRAFT_8864 [Aspergillus saccharolyticus JOP 1030-1]|uniref:Uncharacterized protein n=1 Tax=Aspergillus saccharolyticus JOP 1030-1 TaxID=1450539 RepID=A0A318ZQU6_9EURO|nr:hypothetical protein BP01DRAFT_8864 [Aspergillus saccharolyticus JOP 1030-1]PYH49896.1 hypothetical protein BP01DRAFT_8864 [Aspergillus saccharolyticus JOP 1030-1]
MNESSQSVLSILTGQSWFWDPMQSNEIRLNPDEQCFERIRDWSHIVQEPNPGSYIPPGRHINEALLTEKAFEPKAFTLRLERGSFLTQHDRTGDIYGDDHLEMGLRLTFDRSPYPQPDEWREMTSSLQAHKMWEWNEFCCLQLPDKGFLSAAWATLTYLMMKCQENNMVSNQKQSQ